MLHTVLASLVATLVTFGNGSIDDAQLLAKCPCEKIDALKAKLKEESDEAQATTPIAKQDEPLAGCAKCKKKQPQSGEQNAA